MNFYKLFILFAVLAVGFTVAEKISFEGYKMIRLNPTTETQLNLISELQHNPDFDVLNSLRVLNQPVFVVLSSEAFDKYSKLLRKNSIEFKVVDNNIQRKIDAESASMGNTEKRETRNIVGKFARYSEINNFIDTLVADYPLLASTYILGQTYEKRNIKGLVLTDKTVTNNKRGIFIDCGFHAREWIAISSCIWMIDKMVYDFNEGDGEMQSILKAYELHIVPLVNADGYEYSHTTFRMWRKNRAVRPGTSCVGVDLNRNFGFQWMKGGSSSNPCSDTYAGPSADSELETKAIENAILNKNNFWDSYLTIHTYGQYWLTSWSYSLDYPSDYNELLAKAQLGAKAISLVKGTNYTVGHSARLFGILSGVSDDWAKGSAGIKYAYTLELSPGDRFDPDGSFGFTLPEDRAPRVGQELYKGVRAFIFSLVQDQQPIPY